jgi:hypothetical protein
MFTIWKLLDMNVLNGGTTALEMVGLTWLLARRKQSCWVCLNRLTVCAPALWIRPWFWTHRMDSLTPETWVRKVKHLHWWAWRGVWHGLLRVPCIPAQRSRKLHASSWSLMQVFDYIKQWPALSGITPLDSAPGRSGDGWRTAPSAHVEPVREGMRCTMDKGCFAGDQGTAKRGGNACLQPQ